MLYFSALIREEPIYKPTADRLFAALEFAGVEYQLVNGTHDIWLRDFMPVQTRSGRWISFRYEPSYLDGYSELRTDFRRDIAAYLNLPVVYSDINLDGGNIVFSPSRRIVIVSDRILLENPEIPTDHLLEQLEQLLEARILLIPSLKSDRTGHADGMVRFVDETIVIGNSVPARNGLEQRIQRTLESHGLTVLDFPYWDAPGDSAVGCYLNYLETENCVFLPVFGLKQDHTAIDAAKRIFSKPVVPVLLREVARDGGCLNCISWEGEAGAF